MKAMILAAGRGERMGSLTEKMPKPLLSVNGTTLLENKILALKAAGISDIIINVCYLGEQIQQFAGDGGRWQVKIQYSVETQALDTAGGLARALPLLGDDAFIWVNADIWSDYPLAQLCQHQLSDTTLAHLVMVTNPPEHLEGDYFLENGLLAEKGSGDSLTFSGMGLMKPEFIKNYPLRRECFSLPEVFRYTIGQQQLSGEEYDGFWSDVGTPDRHRAVCSHVGKPS